MWSISTDWLLDVGLRRQLRIQLADVQVQGARIGYAQTLWSVRNQLRAALLSLLINEQRSALLNQAITQQTQLQAKLQQRIKLGEAASTEVLTTNLELGRLRTTLTEVNAQYATAQAQLARLLAVPTSALQLKSFSWTELLQVVGIDVTQLQQWREQALLARGDLEQAVLAYHVCRRSEQVPRCSHTVIECPVR